MMMLHNLADLIHVRDYLLRQMEHPTSPISKEQKRPLEAVIKKITSKIIEVSLAMDIDAYDVKTIIRTSSDADFEKSFELVKNPAMPNTTTATTATVTVDAKGCVTITSPHTAVTTAAVAPLEAASTDGTSLNPVKAKAVKAQAAKKKGAFRRADADADDIE